jgi:hypothetical protein
MWDLVPMFGEDMLKIPEVRLHGQVPKDNVAYGGQIGGNGGMAVCGILNDIYNYIRSL